MKYARECLRDYPVVTSSEKTVKLTMTVDTFNCLTIVPCLFLLLLTLQYKVCFCFVFYARFNPSKHCRLGRDVAKLVGISHAQVNIIAGGPRSIFDG